MKRIKALAFSGIASLLIASLAACGGGAATTATGSATRATAAAPAGGSSTQTRLTWAAGSLGGGWYQQAGGIAQILQAKVPGLTIKVIPGGGLANVPAVDQHKVDMAFGLPPFDAAAYHGQTPFASKLTNVRGIATDFGLTYMHFFVAADSKLTSVADIFQKHEPIKIAIPQAGSSDAWVFDQILKYYKVTPADIRSWGGEVFQGNYTDIVDQYKNHNVDAVWVALAVPGAAVTEAAASRPVRFLSLPPDLVNYLTQAGLQRADLPIKAYKGAVNTAPVVTVTEGNEIIVNKDVPEKVVYEITKAIIDNVSAIKQVSPAFSVFTIQAALHTAVPLAAGAKKAYQEAGAMH